MHADELRREFEARAPWVTKFVVDGVAYGGKYDPYEDPRTDWFFEEFPESRTILDLGSLEGAQSFRLAERPTVERVLGLEARPKNLEKANFVRQILDIDKVRFARADLEKEDLRQFGRFDAVFCAGVLYHVPEPWKLIEQISQVTDNLFVWTHYAADDNYECTVNGYRGWFYKEFGWEDAQSGVSPKSFWLLFDDLLNLIRNYGFEIMRVIDKTPVTPHGPITALSARKPGPDDDRAGSVTRSIEFFSRTVQAGEGCRPPGSSSSRRAQTSLRNSVAKTLIDILACPSCKDELAPTGSALRCKTCGRSFPVRDGVPILLTEPGDAEVIHEGDLDIREGYDPWLHRMILQSLNDDQVVLDFGSGNMSLDDPCIIRMDVKLTPYVDLVADLHSLPFKNGTIDFAFGVAVLEHLRQPFVAAEQLYAALRPGGYVYSECNFVFAYHGFPHHYFNASVHGLEQVFQDFTKLRLGIAPFQMPSFALENVIKTYVALFHADNEDEANLVNQLNEILSFPLRQYDSKFTPETAFRLAAGGYYLGIKQPTGSENVIPPPVWDIFANTQELRDRFPRPLDLAVPDNLMFWAQSEGRRLYPEIYRYYERIQPFSKDADRPFDRRAIRSLPPIPDYGGTAFSGIE